MSVTAYLHSPLGLLSLTGSDAGLSAVSFHNTEGHAATGVGAVLACL